MIMLEFLAQPEVADFARRAAFVIADAGAKGVLLLAAVSLLMVGLRRQSAAVRHLVWALALAGLLALPLLSAGLPRWGLPVLPAEWAGVKIPAARDTPRAPASFAPTDMTMEDPVLPAMPAPPVVEPVLTPADHVAPAPVAAPPSIGLRDVSSAVWIPAVWFSVAALSLVPLLLGHLALARLTRRSRTVTEPEALRLTRNLSRAIGLRRSVRILEGEDTATPLAFSTFRPTILLPGTATDWTSEKTQAMLTHELGHIHRRDCAVQILALIARALNWFNPLAWYAMRRLRAEREQACDDLVLRAGSHPASYAEHLLDLARSLRQGDILSNATVTMARRSQLEGRLLAILDRTRNRRSVTRAVLWGGLIVTAATLVVLGAAGLKAAEEPETPPAKSESSTHIDEPVAEVGAAPEAMRDAASSEAPPGVTVTNSIGMKLRLIQPGSFLMGSPADEKGRDDDETQHEVVLTKPYYIGVTEVTQAQYEEVMSKNPSEFKGANLPVEQVSWNEATEFCRRLSQKEANLTYRLPTAVEWEYACRAGTTTRYYWGEDPDYTEIGDYAVYNGNSGSRIAGASRTKEVGQKKPNAWGLFDMSGNVLEWCSCEYGEYPWGPRTSATGLRSDIVMCGGSWVNNVQECRSAYQGAGGQDKDARAWYVGFRVVAVPAAAEGAKHEASPADSPAATAHSDDAGPEDRKATSTPTGAADAAPETTEEALVAEKIRAEMRRQARELSDALAEDDSSRLESGIFLLGNEGDAIDVPVKGPFLNPEPASCTIRPEPEADLLDFEFARAGGPSHPGGDMSLAENRYEKDNRGYYTHLYLQPSASRRLARAMEDANTGAVLVIGGLGKGRVEPIDVEGGHWGVANIKYAGPGNYLTVSINTHIMAAWNESGQAPEPSDPARDEVEYSIKDSIRQRVRQTASYGIGSEVPRDAFCRTGELGAALYSDLVDSGAMEEAIQHIQSRSPDFGLSDIAERLSINLPAGALAAILQRVKNQEFRRGMMDGFTQAVRTSRTLDQPGADALLGPFLDDPDPLVVTKCFVFSTGKDVRSHRTAIAESVNTCFEKNLLPPGSLHLTELVDRIVKERMTECAPALGQYLMTDAPPDTLSQGVNALGSLGKLELLGKVVLGRHDMREGTARIALGFYQARPQDAPNTRTAKIATLLTISDVALGGGWSAGPESHKALVAWMTGYVGDFYGRVRVPVPEKEPARSEYQKMRKALVAWIDKPAGARVLGALARSNPQPEEMALFVSGMENPDPKTVVACISGVGALGRLGVPGAASALLKVFDRDDALEDLHPSFRGPKKESDVLPAVAVLPPARDNLAYAADAMLFSLAGGREAGMEPPPPYTDEKVLEARRNFWRQWLESRDSDGENLPDENRAGGPSHRSPDEAE